jgi:membrane complex biogenesis BtpA family protein
VSWLKEVLGTEKPIIAMCHLQAMPGDPHYDSAKGMAWVLQRAREDLRALQEGGVDAVMFSNEYSLPYLTKVRAETVAAMARIIGELQPDIRVPYGVNVLWDPYASLDLAAATGALFVREIFTGVYASDFGLWNTNCGEVIRHKYSLGADKVRLLYNIVPEASAYLSSRNIQDIARSTVFNGQPDALCVSGLTAGSVTDKSVLRAVKEAVPETLVLVNTGCCAGTIQDLLSIADGAVVGTTFKYDGKFENPADKNRVHEFMKKVREIR